MSPITRIGRSPLARWALYYALLGVGVWALVTLFPSIPPLLVRFRAISLFSAVARRGRGLEEVVEGGGAPGAEPLSQSEWAVLAGLAMLGALALVVPVTWVYMLTKQRRGYDQSVVQAVIILPMIVAGTVILVQSNLALAFALAAIVAVIRFRNTLKDTKDTVYIFLAIAVGVAVGVFAPAVAAVMSVVFNAVVLLLWKFNVGNIYADQRGLGAPLPLADALVGPGAGGEPLAVGDPALLAALTPDELSEVALRAARLRQYVEARAGAKKKKRFNGLVLVHAVQLEPAQRAVEPVLQEQTKRWKLAEIQRGDGGKATFEYLIRLDDEQLPAALLEELKARGAPHVVAAEYRSLRGLGKKEKE